KILEAVLLSFFKRATNRILADSDLGNFVFIEQALESTIVDPGGLRGGHIETLNPKQQQDRSCHVPEVDVSLFVLWIHHRALSPVRRGHIVLDRYPQKDSGNDCQTYRRPELTGNQETL